MDAETFKAICSGQKIYVPYLKYRIAGYLAATALSLSGAFMLASKADTVKTGITEEQIRAHPDFPKTYKSCLDMKSAAFLQGNTKNEAFDQCDGITLRHMRGQIFGEQFHMGWSTTMGVTGLAAMFCALSALTLMLTGTSRKPEDSSARDNDRPPAP